MSNDMASENLFGGRLEGEVRSYDEFMAWCTEMAENKQTSGHNQEESLIGYTALNFRRMQRLNKTFKLSELAIDSLARLEVVQHWLVFTESWCGDSAQTLPIINKVAEGSSGKILLQVVMRDENLAVMDEHRTNGSLAIPKLVVLDDQGKQVYEWGPRPTGAQKLLQDWKANPQGKDWEAFELELHTWYARDKGQSSQVELIQLIEKFHN